MPIIILFSFYLGIAWVIRRDIRSRTGISNALWIPTIWLAILASRPVSMWIGGFDSDGGSLGGNIVDAVPFFLLIASSFVIVNRRGINWSQLVADNKGIFLFYLYFLVSVLWSEHSFSAFKRLFKDFGSIFVLLVILTEQNPRDAVKTVFVRTGYLLIPLSYLFIRYFPDIGRRYNIHSGVMEAVGVTTQKNSLGAMIMVCGLVIIFDLMDRANTQKQKWDKLDLWLRWGTLAIGFFLLRLCDSKTSMVCLVVGGIALMGSRLPMVERNLYTLAKALIAGVVVFMALDSVFDLKGMILGSLGRDATLTGRTDVWAYLLNLHTDPIFGMGFCTIWDSHFRADFPNWMADSAHNGYLEMYLDGGWIGVLFLMGMVGSIFLRTAREMAGRDLFAVLRFTIVVITILYNISESIYGRLSPGWFFFLMAGVNVAPQYQTEAINFNDAEEPVLEEEESDSPLHFRQGWLLSKTAELS